MCGEMGGGWRGRGLIGFFAHTSPTGRVRLAVVHPSYAHVWLLQVSCGTTHVLLVVEGAALACGSGLNGQLGLGPRATKVTTPTHIAEVSAGGARCGHQHTHTHHHYHVLEPCAPSRRAGGAPQDKDVLTALPLPFLAFPGLSCPFHPQLTTQGATVSKVFAGPSTSHAVCDPSSAYDEHKRGAFAWGAASHGSLGLAPAPAADVYVPRAHRPSQACAHTHTWTFGCQVPVAHP